MDVINSKTRSIHRGQEEHTFLQLIERSQRGSFLAQIGKSNTARLTVEEDSTRYNRGRDHYLLSRKCIGAWVTLHRAPGASLIPDM